MLPLWWHCDGVEIYRNTEFMVWSWASAVAEALNIWDNKFVYCLLPALFVNMKPVFEQINAEITRLIGWDLGICEKGVGAERGFYDEVFDPNCSRARLAGKPLTFKACFAGAKADGNARKEMHAFVRNYSCTWFCEECLAAQPFKNAPKATNYKDFRRSAPWRNIYIYFS